MYIHPTAKAVPGNNYAYNHRSCTSYTNSGFYTMCERDLRWKTPPEIWEWRTSCPISHPYVFESGKSCCQTNYEDSKTGQGEQCDGSVLNRESTCCKGERLRCPTTFIQQQCSNNPSGKIKLSISNLNRFFSDMSNALADNVEIICDATRAKVVISKNFTRDYYVRSNDFQFRIQGPR